MLIIKHSILCFCFSVIYLLQEQYENKKEITENWISETKPAEINEWKNDEKKRTHTISATGMELKGVKHIATCECALDQASIFWPAEI